jgi:hypothetical protein
MTLVNRCHRGELIQVQQSVIDSDNVTNANITVLFLIKEDNTHYFIVVEYCQK